MKKLRKALEEYLEIRRALGFKLREAAGLLRQFVAFADHEGSSFVSRKLALKWATQPPNALRSTWAERLGMVRRFAAYLSASDPRTEIPPQDLLPYRYQRKPPYFYTGKEILTLISAAKRLGPPRGLRAHTYSTLFGLLAATGMRISEPIGLDRSDVDLHQGVLTIRQAKFGKSRLVPLHASTVRNLREYARLRDRLVPNPMSPNFFVSDHGTRLTDFTVRRWFVILSRQIGLRGVTDSHGPRLHDLRHGFVIKTLVKWYRSGVDVERRMPILTTYLGHGHVADTYWYISATPQLLRLATLRSEKSNRRLLP
jgi:integrase